MLLENLNTINGGPVKQIRVGNGIIESVNIQGVDLQKQPNEECISFDNALVFPGLINSHDHLDFNLFPQLGNHVYKNYVDWGNDIHVQNKVAIDAVLQIPKPLRAQWGMYKNLITGVTTVVQHGESLIVQDAAINIFNDCHSLHSVRLEKRWKYRLNKPFEKLWPFVIHVGEGTDAASYSEINELLRWNIFKRKLIGIHAVVMDREQAKNFEALIWCPDSNIFLLGATAAVDQLKNSTKILFGTDSTVSANWNIWHQLRMARSMALLTDEELVNSLTTVAAEIWKLKNKGALKEHYDADMVIAKRKYGMAKDDFFSINPEDILLVFSKGTVVLFDECLLNQLKQINVNNYSKIYINNQCKYVQGDLPALIKKIKVYNPAASFPVEIE